MSTSRFYAKLALALFVSALAHNSLAADGPLSPKQVLKVSPDISNKKEAENISGAACAVLDAKRPSCLLIGDEVRFARFFTLDGDTLVPGGPLFLLPKKYKDGTKTREYDETDAEGIAFSNGSYFLIGSHGLNKSGKLQPSRYFIYRVSVDRLTGLPADMGDKKKPSAQVEKSANLQTIIHDDQQLNTHEADIPDDNGINIEGVAVSGDDLYLGFRGPLIDGKAVVASLPIKDAFDNPHAKLKTYSVDLGKGQGVRDIAAVEGGFLVLSGPQRDMSGPAGVCFWKPGGIAERCHDVIKAGPADSKPEALTVLETTADHFKVLIMSDGPKNGAPAIYEVPRQ